MLTAPRFWHRVTLTEKTHVISFGFVVQHILKLIYNWHMRSFSACIRIVIPLGLLRLLGQRLVLCISYWMGTLWLLNTWMSAKGKITSGPSYSPSIECHFYYDKWSLLAPSMCLSELSDQPFTKHKWPSVSLLSIHISNIYVCAQIYCTSSSQLPWYYSAEFPATTLLIAQCELFWP